LREWIEGEGGRYADEVLGTMEYEQLGPLISELMPGSTMASQLYAEALFHVGSHLEPITYSDLKSLIHKLVHPRLTLTLCTKRGASGLLRNSAARSGHCGCQGDVTRRRWVWCSVMRRARRP
jgi:hypothetical protein